VFALLLTALLSGCNYDKAPDATATAPAQPPTAAAAPIAAPAAAASVDAEMAPTPVPDSLDGVWQAIDANNADLKAMIENGDLANVHGRAFAIRDLVAALPGKSDSLSADEQEKLDHAVTFVATLAS